MTDPEEYIAVGGLGGSGTRVVAEILCGAGYYLGPKQNASLDNLLFTFLFQRPSWFATFPSEASIQATLEIFVSAMKRGLESQIPAIGAVELARLLGDLDDFEFPLGLDRECVMAIQSMPPPNLDDYRGLAWKEPNTHIFIPQFAKAFPKMKYIHVIRHGLDMALSGNKNQLRNWGKFLGIQPKHDEPIERTQLRFWITANQRMVNFGRAHMVDRFFLLNYDALCAHPKAVIAQLYTFLGIDADALQIEKQAASIATTSQNRFRTAPPDLFGDDDRASVRAFGFDVNL